MIKDVNVRVDRNETYSKKQSDNLVELEEKATCGNEVLMERLADVIYQNEQGKTDNSKFWETLNKVMIL